MEAQGQHMQKPVEHEPGGRSLDREVPVPAGQWEIDLKERIKSAQDQVPRALNARPEV